MTEVTRFCNFEKFGDGRYTAECEPLYLASGYFYRDRTAFIGGRALGTPPDTRVTVSSLEGLT